MHINMEHINMEKADLECLEDWKNSILEKVDRRIAIGKGRLRTKPLYFSE